MQLPTFQNVELYQDGAVIDEMVAASKNPWIAGFTTNPTLMAKAGIKDYELFAKEVIEKIPSKPISFEVFSDDLQGMEREAKIIDAWGENIYIKVPISTTSGTSTVPLIKDLSNAGIALNITAIFTLDQVEQTVAAISDASKAIISVFAGRIADTGVDPVPMMKTAREILGNRTNQKLLWASPREVLNVYQADQCGCDIITATPDILKKLSLSGKNLEEFSRETVQMFYEDAENAGFKI